MVSPVSSMRPDEVRERLYVLGADLARKRHAARILRTTGPSVLARLAIDLRESEKVSRDEAQQLARASDIYLEHLHAAADAERAAQMAEVRYEAEKARFEAARTAEVTERSYMQTFGVTAPRKGGQS